MINTTNIEHKHDNVFGKTFAMYDKKEMINFIEPFKIRFERNNLNPHNVFDGKKCLDAGCGNGRGSIFMAMHGAKEIHSIDISATNIESTIKNAEMFGFSNIINTQLSSLESLNFKDKSFDFVWCNGVLMHTYNPDKCLQELARVLKIGGQSWIYVYGSGGVYWYCVYKMREMLKDYSESECIMAMKLAQIPVPFLAEYMDDWKAPYLRTYTNNDFSKRLLELGFKNTKPIFYGMDYDTSHRINSFKQDAIFLGEGDLRYFLQKESDFLEENHPISDSIYGSDYIYPEIYKKIIDDKFVEINKKVQNSLIFKVLACAYIQRNLRDKIFSSTTQFNLSQFIDYCEEAINLLDTLSK